MQASCIGGLLGFGMGVALGKRLLGGLLRAVVGEAQVADGHFSSIDFDGVSDYLRNGTGQTYDIGASFSIGGWINMPSVPSGTDAIIIDVTDNTTVNKNRIVIFVNGSDSKWRFIVGDSSASFNSATSTDVAITGWVHIMGVKDGTTSIKLYLNGVEVASNTTSIVTTTDASNRVSAIAGSARNDNKGTALLLTKAHSVSLWDVALSQNAIREMFNHGAGSMFDLSRDEGDYTSSANLQHRWRVGRDTSDIGADSGVAGAIDINADSASIDATDIVKDAPDGGHLVFDGANDFLLNTTAQAYDVGASFTVGGWAKADTFATGHVLLDIDDKTTESEDRILLYVTSLEHWSIFVTNAAGASSIAETAVTPDTGVWYHAMAVKNGTTSLKLYINGEEVDENTTSIVTTTDATNRHCAMGAKAVDATLKWDGPIRDCGVWDVALSEAEVQDIYNGGHKDFDLRANGKVGGYASSANLKHWFRCGRPLGSVGVGGDYFTDQVASGGIDLTADDASLAASDVGIDSNSGVHMDFGGASEFLRVSGETVLGIVDTWTVSLWANPDALAIQETMFDAIPLSPFESGISVQIRGDQANDPVRINLRNSAGTTIKLWEWDSVFTIGTWTYIAFTWDGTTLKGYFDGTEVTATTKTTDDAGSQLDDLRSIIIGAAPGALQEFDGLMGHVAIWSAVLSADAIRQVWTSRHKADLLSAHGAYSSQASLQHWWKIGEDPDDMGKDYGRAGTLIDMMGNPQGITHEDDVFGDAP